MRPIAEKRSVTRNNKVSFSTFSQNQKLLRQKQLEIEDFCVYWDTECELLEKLPANQIQVRNVASLSG